MRASAQASGDDLQSIEWLMRAKTLAAGAARRSSHSQSSLVTHAPIAVAGRIEGSDVKQGYASSLGKPFTADGGETDTAYEEDDLIAWAT
jgi:hypothetical protein